MRAFFLPTMLEAVSSLVCQDHFIFAIIRAPTLERGADCRGKKEECVAWIGLNSPQLGNLPRL